MFKFGDFILDIQSGRLLFRGEDVDIGAKPLALLKSLVNGEGRVMTKDELMEAVWPGVVVTEDSLTQAMSQLRKALGPDGPGLIRTFSRRGYLFTASKEKVTAEPTVATARALAIAVSSFRAVGSGDSADWLAEAISGEVASGLARYRDLEVIRVGTLPHSHGAQHAMFDLEGVVQSYEGAIKVIVTLTETAHGRLVWSDSWTSNAKVEFALTQEIADGVVNVLASHGVLLNAASEIVRRRSYSDRGAFSEYLRGRHHASKFNAEDALKALEYSEKAVAIDPEFPRGWLGKAWAHNQLASFGIDTAANDRSALAAARKASELDPYDAEAWIALGEGLGNTGELEAAEAALDRAMRLGPSNADVLAMFSGWAALFGRVDEGVEAAEKALRLNPNWPIWYASAARRAYFHAGRYKEALSFVVRRQPKTRSLDDVVTAACCAAALGDPGNALQWRGEAMAMGFISAELYLDYAGIRRPEQRALVSQLIQTAGFDLRNKP